MPGLFGRRSLVRNEDLSGGIKRSSSLPPEADCVSVATSSSAGGRGRSANPIGLSRNSIHGGGGGRASERSQQRSQSLTRDQRRGSSALRRTDSTSSFQSVGSYGSDIQEPGWFAHAFHGSGACTCGVVHEGKCADADDNDQEEDNSGSGNDGVVDDGADAGSIKSSGLPLNDNGDVPVTKNNSGVMSTVTDSTDQNSSYEKKDSDSSRSTIASLSKTIAASHNSSFTSHNRSISSEILNDGSEISSYMPKSTRSKSGKNHQRQRGGGGHDSDISSITMDRNLASVDGHANRDRPKSLAKSVKRNTLDKIKKRSSRNTKQGEQGAEGEGRGRRRRQASQTNHGQDVDARIRERSRSLVRDARSFLSGMEGGESQEKEESKSVSSRSDTIRKGGSFRRSRMEEDKKEQEELLQKKEDTIRELRAQLEEVKKERDAHKSNSERMMARTTQQKEELERELGEERRVHTDASQVHERELDEWKEKARRASEGDARVERELRRALSRISEVEAAQEADVRRLQKENEEARERASEWKSKHDALQRRHKDVLDERDEEAAAAVALEGKLEKCRRAIESLGGGTGDSSADIGVNDELVVRIEELADENGRLLERCRRLEEEAEAAANEDSKREGERDASRARLEAMSHDMAKDLESARRDAERAEARIATLRAENIDLRASFASQAEMARRTKGLLGRMRSSLLSGDLSLPQSVLAEVDGEGGEKATSIIDMEHEEALAAIEDMLVEADALHEWMKEVVELIAGMNQKVAEAEKARISHEKEYEAKIASLEDEMDGVSSSRKDMSLKLDSLRTENRELTIELEEANLRMVSSATRDDVKQKFQLSKDAWNRERRELSSSVDSLKKENERLRVSMEEMNGLVAAAEECADKLKEENVGLNDEHEYYEQQLRDMESEKEANQYLREEVRRISSEREESYGACKALQREVDALKKAVKESEGRLERLHSEGSSVDEGSREQLAELTRANESLTGELEQKNEALQAVQSALESLKEEQSTIKETIVELRQENAKLRDSGGGPPSQAPSSPKSILKRRPSPGSSDGSTVVRLEGRIKKVDKENRGLREANATLSAKLFDEMEKTDALRVANEGLAARICKLVAFIQQNTNGVEGGGEGGSAPPAPLRSSSSNGGSSSRRNSSSKRNKSPAPPRRKK